jgi:hypothetical protein
MSQERAAAEKPFLKSLGPGFTKERGNALTRQGTGDLSANEMRGYEAQEFAGCDNLGALPELRKMALVAPDIAKGIYPILHSGMPLMLMYKRGALPSYRS